MAAPAARLAVVLGSPGVGKSRLLDEFTGRLDGATVLVAACEAAGGATFAPLAKALRAVLGIGAGTGGCDLRRAIDAAVPGSEADRGRIAAGVSALLAGTPASPEETFFVVRRLLTGLAAAQPVVLVLDDLQWAEPLLLDLLEHLVQWSTGVPLLLLAAARPDFRDARSALAAPGRLATVEGEILRIVTWNHRGHVDVFRQFGTILDGGPFEHVLVRVLITDGPHIQRYELFDVGDEDRALARFAELCRVDGGSP
jgi:hypothetical protein